MEKLLKGNFEVKRPVADLELQDSEKESVVAELRKKAMSSLGGSMVYMERDRIVWDGDEV